MSNKNSTKRDPNTPELYSSGTLKGLKFFDEKEDSFDVDTNLICSPNITLVDSNTKAVFDFTGCTSISDTLFLDVLLSGLTTEGVSSGITLEKAKHIDSITNEQSDISGVFNFKNAEGKIVFTDVVSITSPQNYDKLYRNSGFIEKPNLDFTTGSLPSTKKNIVKNVLGRTITPNFSSLGARVGDYVQFLEGNNKGILYQINGISADNSLHEIVSLTAGNSYDTADIIEENRFNIDTNVNVYRLDDGEGVRTFRSGVDQTVSYNNRVSRITVDVVDDGISKYFIFDSLYKRPVLLLNTGSLYVFDTSSVRAENGNDFNLSKVSDGIHNNGAKYSSGVQRYTNTALVYFPQVNVNLYYYSTQTEGMGNKIIVRGDNIGIAATTTTLGGFQSIQTGVESTYFGTTIQNLGSDVINSYRQGTEGSGSAGSDY